MDNRQKFLEAVKTGELELVKSMLQAEPQLVRAKDEQGVSTVLLSVYYGREAVTRLLLSTKPVLDIWEAAAVGDLPRVQELLGKDATLLNAYAPDGFTPLGLAAFFGHAAVLEMLLEGGAQVNLASRNAMQVRPLHSAVAQRDILAARQMAELLLAHGAEVNAVQMGSFTALHEAASRGDAALVRLLLAAGADPAACTDTGQTPRDLAKPDVLSLLGG